MDVRGVHEVQRGTFSIHFHRAVPGRPVISVPDLRSTLWGQKTAPIAISRTLTSLERTFFFTQAQSVKSADLGVGGGQMILTWVLLTRYRLSEIIVEIVTYFRRHPGKPNQRKASSWTFRRGIPEQKFNVNRPCFFKEKHQNSQK